jgi:hypothetical protein
MNGVTTTNESVESNPQLTILYLVKTQWPFRCGLFKKTNQRNAFCRPLSVKANGRIPFIIRHFQICINFFATDRNCIVHRSFNGNRFLAVGNAEMSNQMPPYTTDHELFVIKPIYSPTGGSCVAEERHYGR